MQGKNNLAATLCKVCRAVEGKQLPAALVAYVRVCRSRRLRRSSIHARVVRLVHVVLVVHVIHAGARVVRPGFVWGPRDCRR